MQLNHVLILLGMALLYIGLLCTALSQQKHFRHRRWAGRLNRIGLRNPGARRFTGALALLASAGLMVFTDGWGFGLVLWVMAAAALAVVVAWVLARSS